MSEEKITPESIEATGREMVELADAIERIPLPDPSQHEGVTRAIQHQREQGHKMIRLAAAIRAGDAYVIE